MPCSYGRETTQTNSDRLLSVSVERAPAFMKQEIPSTR